MMKGVANQSWSNTWPSGHTKVTLNPTGGAGVKSSNEIFLLLRLSKLSCFIKPFIKGFYVFNYLIYQNEKSALKKEGANETVVFIT